MDATTVIVSALLAGASGALQETAGTAIKDAYQALTTLIRNKMKGDSKATAALEGHAEDPATWKKPLEKSIRETGSDQDAEIVAAAERLLELHRSQQSSAKYDVRIKGEVKGLVQGDNARVTMKFDEAPQKTKRRKTPRKS